jgi:hypothetical protein
MYACIHETGADFSRGREDERIGYLLFATLPHHAAVREWLYASTVSGDSRCSKSLFTTSISCACPRAAGHYVARRML